MILLKSYLKAEEKWNSKNVICSSLNLNSIYEYNTDHMNWRLYETGYNT